MRTQPRPDRDQKFLPSTPRRKIDDYIKPPRRLFPPCINKQRFMMGSNMSMKTPTYTPRRLDMEGAGEQPCQQDHLVWIGIEENVLFDPSLELPPFYLEREEVLTATIDTIEDSPLSGGSCSSCNLTPLPTLEKSNDSISDQPPAPDHQNQNPQKRRSARIQLNYAIKKAR